MRWPRSSNTERMPLLLWKWWCVTCMLPAERGIIVREPKMTHVFKGGECDCGDRWRWEARSNNSTVLA